MEIEFSKNGEGKVLIGIGCAKINGEYKKKLNLDDISELCENTVIGDKVSKNIAGKTLVTLVFNKDESIDVLIKKLKELKRLNVKKTLELQEKVLDDCNDPNCSCQLTKGC